MNKRIWASSIFASLLGVALISLAAWVSWDDPKQISASWVLLILAAAGGWLFGMLVSPYGPSEKEQFSEYSKIVSTAVGGYLVGKIDPIVSSLTRADFNTLAIVRTAGTFSAFLLATIIVFLFRRYATI
jgi:hypothetical protein